MERRKFLAKAAIGATAVGLAACGKQEPKAPAAPAAAPSAPAVQTGGTQVKWRLASSFPKSLDTIFGAAEVLAKRVFEATGGKFDIRVFAGGEIVPGLQVLDAVQQGTVEICHTASYYFVGKDPVLPFDTALPFGLNVRQQNAWMYYGGGLELMRDVYREYNVVNMPGGNTGCQMGGWFRNEVKSLKDLNGLKMRIPGFGGKVMAALGAVPQTIAGGDIYPSLEKGTIDATEWVGPYDDEKLGFYKVAKHYYTPGWWEPGPQLSFLINAKEFEKLPKEYQAILEAAAAEANIRMIANYDAKNPAAMARLLQQGVKLHRYPKDVMDAAYKAAMALYNDEAAKNPKYKKVFDNWNDFRQRANSWFGIAEGTFDSYMATVR